MCEMYFGTLPVIPAHTCNSSSPAHLDPEICEVDLSVLKYNQSKLGKASHIHIGKASHTTLFEMANAVLDPSPTS